MTKVLGGLLRVGLACSLILPQPLWAARSGNTGSRPPAKGKTAGETPRLETEAVDIPEATAVAEPVLRTDEAAVVGVPEGLDLSAPALEPGQVEAVVPAGKDEPTTTQALGRMAAGSGDKSGRAAAQGYDGEDAGSKTQQLAASPSGEIHNLSFPWEAKDDLKKSKVFTTMRLVRGPERLGSWSAHVPGARVRVVVRKKSQFISRIEDTRTTQIKGLKKADLQGFYPARVLKKSIGELRKIVAGWLGQWGAAVSSESWVHVMRILPQKLAKNLTPHREKFAQRGPVEIPEGLSRLHEHLPKLVLWDVRGFKGAVPAELVDDMGKLMKAGVHFGLIMDRPLKGPGSVRDFIGRGLGDDQNDQHDRLFRWKLAALTDGGNAALAFQNDYPVFISYPRFSQSDVDSMQQAGRETARQLGIGPVEWDIRGGDRLVLTLPDGADAGAFLSAYEGNLGRVGISAGDRRYQTAFVGGKTQVIIRPSDLASGVERLRAELREQDQLFARDRDIVVISKDPELKKAVPGAVHSEAFVPALAATEQADVMLAALLGEYRQDKPGDLAMSASMIKKVLENHESYGGNQDKTVFMRVGDVMNGAFGWAFWEYEKTGVWPSLEDVTKEGRRRWDKRDSRARRAQESGAVVAGYPKVLDTRLKAIYEALEGYLKDFPILLGTELPQLTVVQRYVKGHVPHYRDILRTTNDIRLGKIVTDAAGRRTLKVAILDIKSGAIMDHDQMRKDIQYLLYDYIGHRSMQYQIGGEWLEVSGVEISFVGPFGPEHPILTDENRLKFVSDTLPRAALKLRREFGQDKELPKAKDLIAKKSPASAGLPQAKIRRKLPAKKKPVDPAEFKTLKLPKKVPGIKIKAEHAQAIISGKKPFEYRSRNINAAAKPFVAIIQTFTDEEKVKGKVRPAEVVGFARMDAGEEGKGGVWRFRMTHVVPVKPYPAPLAPGAVIWTSDVPVKGAKNLRKKP